MPINDADKLSLLWKRYVFGKTETTSDGKDAIEESVPSNHIILPSHIWSKGSEIPVPPAALSEVVESHVSGVPLLPDPTVPTNVTWMAVQNSSIGFTNANRLRDWIPPFIHPEYEIRVYKSSNFIESNRLLPGTAGFEWVFDYSAGVLHFPNSLPSGITTLYIAGYRYIGSKGIAGGGIEGENLDLLAIGTPSIGTFENGYIKNITPRVTTIADAVEYINRAMLDFSTIQPPELSRYELVPVVNNVLVEKNNTYLSIGHTKNFISPTPISGQIEPGQAIHVIHSNQLTTDWVGPFGPTQYGTLELTYNLTTSKGSKTLTMLNDGGIYTNLELENESAYPEGTDSQWKSIRARAKNLICEPGYNTLILHNSAGGQTPLLHFVYNNSSNTPIVSTARVYQGYTTPFLKFSSGIPHYNINNKLQFEGTIQNCVSDVYLNSGIAEIDSSPRIFNRSLLSTGKNNIPSILTKGQDLTFSEHDVIMQPEDTSDRLFLDASAILRVRGNNTRVNGLWYVIPTKVNVMYGDRNQTETISPIRELRVPVLDGLGTRISGAPIWASRIYMSEGDTPGDVVTLSESDWNSNNALPLHEASVVGGVIRCDKTNYTTNWLPVGPNYSNKPDAQWITFMFRRNNVSMMRLEIEGNYSGVWVKLPGIGSLDNAPNGWLRANAFYDGYGNPGQGANSNGCALRRTSTGYTQILDLTFGTLSSANSTNNIILLRFRLELNDEIRGLRIGSVIR